MFRAVIILCVTLFTLVSTSIVYGHGGYSSYSRSRLALRPRLFARVEVPERIRVEKFKTKRVIQEEIIRPAPLVEERIRERIVQPEIREKVIQERVVQPEIREEIREKVIVPQQKEIIRKEILREEVCPDCPSPLRLRRHH